MEIKCDNLRRGLPHLRNRYGAQNQHRGIQPKAAADPRKACDGAVPPGDGGVETGKSETMQGADGATSIGSFLIYGATG